MASLTRKTEQRRRKKRASVGRQQAKKRARAGTPKFPINPEATKVINFDMFAILAVPLLNALKWVHGFVGNWGWAIIVLTLLINLAMFPLRHKSVVSMRKMQEIQPQMKAIQDR